MIGVLGGLTAAILWGASTIVASRSTRMLGSQQALAYVFITGLGLAAVLAVAFEGVPRVGGAGAAWALVAGVASVTGLSMLYRGLRIGKVGVVAPIASTEGAFAAVLSVAVLGEQVTPQVVVALAVVVAGVLAVTFHGRLADIHLRPSLYAITAASLFGVGLISSSRAGAALGPFWTILIARVVGVGLLAIPLAVGRRLPLPGRRALLMVTFSGVAEVIGFAAYIAGSQHGIAVAAVLAAQFAAVATFGSYLVYGERMSRRQLAGALVIMAGVTAVAVLRTRGGL